MFKNCFICEFDYCLGGKHLPAKEKNQEETESTVQREVMSYHRKRIESRIHFLNDLVFWGTNYSYQLL